jgi:hypothetical protein
VHAPGGHWNPPGPTKALVRGYLLPSDGLLTRGKEVNSTLLAGTKDLVNGHLRVLGKSDNYVLALRKLKKVEARTSGGPKTTG